MTFKALGQRSKLQFHLQAAEGIAEILSSFRGLQYTPRDDALANIFIIPPKCHVLAFPFSNLFLHLYEYAAVQTM